MQTLTQKWAVLFLVNEIKRCNEFQFYWYYYSTCFGQPFCPSSGVLSHTSALVHFMQLYSKRSSQLHKMYQSRCAAVTMHGHTIIGGGHDMFCTNKSYSQVSCIRPNSGLPKCKSCSKPGYPDRGSCHVLQSTHASSHIFCSVLNSSLTLHCYVVHLLPASLNLQHGEINNTSISTCCLQLSCHFNP